MRRPYHSASPAPTKPGLNGLTSRVGSAPDTENCEPAAYSDRAASSSSCPVPETAKALSTGEGASDTPLDAPVLLP